MSILTKIYSKIYDADSVQTTFNEDAEGVGGEVDVIFDTEETTSEE